MNMISKGLVVAVVMCGVAGPAAIPGAAQVRKLEYEAFCKLPDAQTKRATFQAMSAENRTEVVRTHLERWRDANRSRLNEKQLTALAELIAALGPDTYAEGQKGEEARAKMRPLAEVQQQLFTREEMAAMQPNAPCIPKSNLPAAAPLPAAWLDLPQSPLVAELRSFSGGAPSAVLVNRGGRALDHYVMGCVVELERRVRVVGELFAINMFDSSIMPMQSSTPFDTLQAMQKYPTLYRGLKPCPPESRVAVVRAGMREGSSWSAEGTAWPGR